MIKIKVFYHLVDLPNWEPIAREQFAKLQSSGLLDAAEVYVNLHYNLDSFENLFQDYQHYPNIKWLHTPCNPLEKEIPTAILMKKVADECGYDFYALYLHAKGITHVGTAKETPTRDWRWLMDYWNIERWIDCVTKLIEGYDVVGCNFKGQPWRHFSGTTSWVTSDFLKKCNRLQLPSAVGFQRQTNNTHGYPWDIEAWWGHNSANFYSMHNSTENLNHYETEYPPHLYRLD